jgi:hypothetical protein
VTSLAISGYEIPISCRGNEAQGQLCVISMFRKKQFSVFHTSNFRYLKSKAVQLHVVVALGGGGLFIASTLS